MQKENLEVPEPTRQKTIEDRVAISLAVMRYVRTLAQFESAQAEFQEACQSVRAALKDAPDQFIAKVDYQNYLVFVSHLGDFKVEEIETI